ncbi:hypothetical protein [Pseudomonas knackmussii]|nr:hypothetical protein [Pseudomonas knackmussii]
MRKEQSMPAEPALGFGPYLVYPATCSIVENGRPLRLGRRAFALLLVLLENAGCVIAHYNGEYEKAASRLRQLFEAASRHSIPLFADWAQHYAGVMRCTGLPLPTTPASGLVRDIVMTLGGSQELASQRAGSSATGWCAPEWLRIEACQLLERGSEGGEAESQLSRALELARRSGALAWELRCATTLARLWRDQGLVAPAREMLASVYARFEEGFATPDLKAARECLATLG